MAEPFLSEIRIMSFGFAPKGWALCNGQLLPINQNQGLFSLLGTTYGGDGRVTFGIPNLQARLPIHIGPGFVLGQQGGENAHTLNSSEMAQHNHTVNALAVAPPAGNPGLVPGPAKLLAQAYAEVGQNNVNVNLYGTGAPAKVFNAQSITPTGGNQAHNNQQPFLVLNFCIALQGIFPSQN
jgi:microcystin-dependent protein